MDEQPNALIEGLQRAGDKGFLRVPFRTIHELRDMFVKDRGGIANHIYLPRGDFLVRARNGEMFSSLTPYDSPTVINLGPGRELYEHQNYIISTAGLNANTGDVLPHITDVGTAFSNHYGLAHDPWDIQIMFAGSVHDGPYWSKYADHSRRFGDNESAQEIAMKLTHPGTEVLNEFVADDLMSMVGVTGPGFLPSAGVNLSPPRRPLRMDVSPNMYQQDFDPAAHEHLRGVRGWGSVFGSHFPDFLWLPTGRPVEDIMQKSGILQMEDAKANPQLAAYLNGKLIVSHPTAANALPFQQNYRKLAVELMNGGEKKIPWDPTTPEPTRIRTHFFPQRFPVER